MDYTLSPSYFTHTVTGQRLHKEVQAVPTAVSDKDLNSVLWSLMEVVKAGGLAGIQFDPDTPGSYRVLLNAVQNLITASANSILAQLPALSASGLRTGDLIFTSGGVARPGTIKGNGMVIPRALFPDLTAYAISDGLVSEAEWTAGAFGRYSVGDGATTIRVPDYRAMVLRGLDEGRGLDVGRLRGVFQAAQGPLHSHTGVTESGGVHVHGDIDEAAWDVQGDGGDLNYRLNFGDNPPYSGSDARPLAAGGHGHGFTTAPAGGADMRVDNLATPFLIKY